MERRVIDPHPEIVWPCAKALKVGNMVFISGQIALRDYADLNSDAACEAQTRECMGYLDDILREAGGSLGDVVKIVTYLVNLDDYPIYSRIRAEYFPNGVPPGTTVRVAGLGLHSAKFEIDATAVLSTS